MPNRSVSKNNWRVPANHIVLVSEFNLKDANTTHKLPYYLSIALTSCLCSCWGSSCWDSPSYSPTCQQQFLAWQSERLVLLYSASGYVKDCMLRCWWALPGSLVEEACYLALQNKDCYHINRWIKYRAFVHRYNTKESSCQMGGPLWRQQQYHCEDITPKGSEPCPWPSGVSGNNPLNFPAHWLPSRWKTNPGWSYEIGVNDFVKGFSLDICTNTKGHIWVNLLIW